MKKVLILALLGISSFGAKAQTYTITNNENCALTFTAICVDPSTCAIVSTGSSVTVTGSGGTGTLVASRCTGSAIPAWEVCWATPPCNTDCTNFPVDPGTAPASCYPGPYLHGILSDCPGGCTLKGPGQPTNILSDPTHLVIVAN